MALKLSGITLGNIGGGPSSLTLEDLADVSVVSPATGDYLRYNATLSEWQNQTIDSDVFGFLDTNLLSAQGVVITAVSGPDTITIGLGSITPSSVSAIGTVTGSNLSGTNTGDQTITLTGDVTGSGTGSFAATLATVNSSPQTNTFRKITVNGKGLVTATSTVLPSDITTALGYVPLDSAGGSVTGPLTVDTINVSSEGYIDTAALTTSTTTPNQVVTTFSATTYRTAKFVVQVSSGSVYQASEIMLIHNGTTVYITEYGNVNTGSSLATFDADISGGNVRLLVTPVNASSTVKTLLTALTV